MVYMAIESFCAQARGTAKSHQQPASVDQLGDGRRGWVYLVLVQLCPWVDVGVSIEDKSMLGN
jgi:hypothetical protein